MKIHAKIALGVAVLSCGLSGPALASHPAGVSVSTVIARMATPIENFSIPGVGRVGQVSLYTLPVLDKLSIPGIGTSLPIIGTITVANGVVIVESIGPVKSLKLPSLPGITTPAKH